MNYFFRTLLFFFFSIALNAQKSLPASPEQSNAKYFGVPREILYLHLDKSTYIDGEEIWFKGYAYDRNKSLPSNASTNFNIQLFNQEGKEVYNGLFFGSRGSFRGNIKIDSTWNNGDYYIKASTNWMNNFVEDEAYTKKIKIIKESFKKEALAKGLQYDFQLLPEGGHLILGTDNKIGFKLINSKGYGVPFEEGYIIDEEGKRVMSFESNQFGMGKFNFRPISGIQFMAVAKFANGEEIKSAFPKIEDTGIGIIITNTLENDVMIELNTNAQTIKNLTRKKHYLLIRQNNLSKKLLVNFLPNETKKRIAIERDLLFEGINTITLFQDNHPILERLFMNSFDKVLDHDIIVQKGFVTKDSLSLSIRMPKKEGVTYDVSISILPEETKSYTPNDNICSAFILKPYVKGFIENEKYYFTNINRKKKYDLDLLLITQGWSKYSWDNIFTKPPKTLYSFNQGFRLKGKIQGTTKENIAKVYIHPTKYQKGNFINIDKSYSFESLNFFPEKGETVRVSGVEADNSFVKPSVYVQVQLNQQIRPLNKEVIREENVAENKEIIKNVKIPKGFITDRTQVLDEVILKAENKAEENTGVKPILKYFGRNAKKITQRMVEDFPTLIDYLRSTGRFFIRDQAPVVSNVIIRAKGTGGVVVVYMNDIEQQDKTFLSILRTEDVDKIYFDRSNHALGMRGGRGGSIRIYTKKFKTGNLKSNYKSIIKYKMKKGYEPIKEFYNPGYTNYLNPGFVDYGVIHWQPWVDFNEDGLGTFKIKDTKLDNIRLFIEGIGSDGSLISKIENIAI